ncbi:MAG: hypothetical protein GY953_08390, partial [bacterium]|nr:hypothetical protein [bacterium]
MRPLAAFLILSAITSGAAPDWRAPAGVELPQPVKPIADGEAGWQASEGFWSVDARTPGHLEAPAWWKGNRPPRGEVVVLELEYRDSLPAPARAEIYSGLGTTNPYSELHRFGGAGDGRWKKARIPVTSDFIFRHGDSIRFRLSSNSASV